MKGRFCITPIKTFSVFLNYFQDYLKFGHKSAFHYLELKWRSAKKYKRGKVICNEIVFDKNNYSLSSWYCHQHLAKKQEMPISNLIRFHPPLHQTSRAEFKIFSPTLMYYNPMFCCPYLLRGHRILY